MSKPEWWTLWGDETQICSKHSSKKAARKEAKECEKAGGATHTLIKVQRVER